MYSEDKNVAAAQKVMLEILKEIHKVCVKNNITYWLDAGTLLGAVRHKGFIPWDDDCDISMPRTDYEKFIEIAQSELNSKFFQEVAMLEPTGCGNPAPVLMTVIRETHAVSLPSHPTHTKFDNGQLKFIFFGGAVFNSILAASCDKSVIFELQQNDGANPQAVVKCVIPFAINDEEKALVLQRYLHDDLAVAPDENLQVVIDGLSIDRSVFIDYYKATRNLVSQNNFCASPLKLFSKIVLPKKNIFQFVFCFAVFQQLGIYEVVRNRLHIHNERTTELSKSAIFNKIVNLNQKV